MFTETLAEPLERPLHVILVEDITRVRAGDRLIVTTAVSVQPLASVTVATYVPFGSPVAVAVV